MGADFVKNDDCGVIYAHAVKVSLSAMTKHIVTAWSSARVDQENNCVRANLSAHLSFIAY